MGRTATVVLAAVGALAGVAGAVEQSSGGHVVAAVVVVTWGAAAIAVAWRQPGPALGLLVAAVTAVLGATALAAAQVDAGSTAHEPVRPIAAAFVPAVGLHLLLALPDGTLRSRGRRVVTGLGYLAALALGPTVGSGDGPLPTAPYLVAALVAAACGALGLAGRYHRASTADRARLQWVIWGAGSTASVGVLVVLLEVLLGWPDRPWVVTLAASVVVPTSVAASTFPRLLTLVDRVLVRTVVVVGLLALVEAVYLFVVIGLGRSPEDEEQSVLVLSMLAAAVCAVLVFPARDRLEEAANQRVYGERRRPDDALRTFSGRMSRSVPMDELLLQLAESLKKSLNLSSSEVWTGAAGTLDRAVSVPDRRTARLTLGDKELAVAARAHVQGNAWLQIWIPDLLAGRDQKQVRAAMVAHLGELLGLIVVERSADDPPFTEDDDRVLAELARQVGLALHNVRLDSALQASLEELEVRNEELAASRLRIVTAADESRRQIERNLHDGAQQHLVALAVKVGLVKQLIDADRATADEMLDQLRGDVQDTLDELRELAHGIYPPLLRDRGLDAALKAAANRSRLPVEVVVDAGVRRHPAETEAAVYFCCLEAMQNAGKHAGDDAHLSVRVSEAEGLLLFEVADDGPGFDVESAAMGQGFVNMRDRVGAIGGVLEVESAPGAGARIRGRIPVADTSSDEGSEGTVAGPAEVPAS